MTDGRDILGGGGLLKPATLAERQASEGVDRGASDYSSGPSDIPSRPLQARDVPIVVPEKVEYIPMELSKTDRECIELMGRLERIAVENLMLAVERNMLEFDLFGPSVSGLVPIRAIEDPEPMFMGSVEALYAIELDPLADPE